MFLSKGVNAIEPSPTLALSALAGKLKAQGQDIVNFSAGEPDFDTPEFVKEAAMQALKMGQTKYTPVEGTLTLRQAVCHKYKTQNNLDYTPDQIIVSNGAKHVLFQALMATLDPGDEVVIPAPYWVSYPDMVKLVHGVPVIAHTREEDNFLITPEVLASKITPRTKWVIFNAPSNPTGMVYSLEHLKALTKVLQDHPHVHILSDDIYEHLNYTGHPAHTIVEVDPSLMDRTLLVNGLSKSHAMTGWRIGFGAGPRFLIEAMTKIQSQSTSNICSITQAAGVAALMGPQDFQATFKEAFHTRRDRIVELVNRCPGLFTTVPHGAFYVYPNCRQLLGKKRPDGKTLDNDQDVAKYLLEQAGVVVVPGHCFGLSPYFRISYATDLDTIEKGCERIYKACALVT